MDQCASRVQCSATWRAPSTRHVYQCTKPDGHSHSHGYAGIFWSDDPAGRVVDGAPESETRIREIVRAEIQAMVLGSFEDGALAAWGFAHRSQVSPTPGPRAGVGDGESGSVETTPGPDSPAIDYKRLAIAVNRCLPLHCEGLRFEDIAGVLEAADRLGLLDRSVVC